MMRDANLKDTIFKHFWMQRCFAQPEVEVYLPEGACGSGKAITDIDVLALRPTAALGFHRVFCDCKTLKGQSPINRSLWLSGLLKFLDGNSGFVYLDLPKIEPDHKLAASKLDITILNVKDFGVFDKSVNYPTGSSSIDVGPANIAKLKGIGAKYPRLQPMVDYLYRDAWKESSFGGLIRHLIGHLRGVSKELDPKKLEHLGLVCDAAAIFAIGLAECCGVLFHQYLHPNEKTLLSDSLKVLIWGGKEQYDLSSALREKLLAARGRLTDERDPLELPEWNLFVQLSRNILDRPSSALHTPWFLRQLAFDKMLSRDFCGTLDKNDLLCAKYAMLTIEYLCRAGGLPRAFEQELVSPTIRIQSQLAELRDIGAKQRTIDSNMAGTAFPLDIRESKGPKKSEGAAVQSEIPGITD